MSFMDWLGTIDVLVRESVSEGKLQPGKITAKSLAKHFNITVGSIMMYYSVWNNLHPKSLNKIVSWGDIDYRMVASEYAIPMTDSDISRFDEVDVIQKTSMYPGVWNKANQTEKFQERVSRRIMLMHLKNRPVKPLNKAQIIQCIKYVSQADDATEALDGILKDCVGSVSSNIITETDAAQIKATREKMMIRVSRGELDGQLGLSGEFPSLQIKSLYQRLEAIKMLAYQRSEDERKRKQDAAVVSPFLFLLSSTHQVHN